VTKTQTELYEKIITCIEGIDVNATSSIEVLAAVIGYYVRKARKK